MNEVEKLYAMAIWFVKTLCIDTNATRATYTLDGFRDREGKDLGDWEIVVRKKKKVSKK